MLMSFVLTAILNFIRFGEEPPDVDLLSLLDLTSSEAL